MWKGITHTQFPTGNLSHLWWDKVIPIEKHCEGLIPDPGPQKDWALTIRSYSNYSPSHFTTIAKSLQKKSSELQVKGQQEADSLWGGILREAPSQNVIQKQEHLRNLKPLTTIAIANIKQNSILTQIKINHQNNDYLLQILLPNITYLLTKMYKTYLKTRRDPAWRYRSNQKHIQIWHSCYNEEIWNVKQLRC